jgi:hypothetical protein
MKPVHIAGLLVAAGALGALAGGAAGVFSSPEPASRDTVLLDKLAEIAEGVDALRDSAAANRDAVADVRERVVAVEMEMDRRKNAPPAIPVDEASSGTVGGATPIVMHGGLESLDPETMKRIGAAKAQMEADLAKRMGDMEAAAKVSAVAAQAGFEKSLRIRSMSEDERWQHAADTLGLNSVQVDELRAAHGTLQEAMEQATTTTTTTTDSGGTMVFKQVDGTKMAEAREAFDERVDTVLNEEQKKAWRDEGFRGAMRGGRAANRIRLSGFRRSTGGGADAGGAVGIEFVGTEAIELEVDDK